MASPAIELKNIHLNFEQLCVFSGISLKIPAGEGLVVIGPSGQGKSSLLKVMAGLIKPSAGEVLIDGKNLWQISDRERQQIAQRTAMLFQKNALFDSLSVEENVAFPLREVAHTPETEIATTVTRLLDAVGILHARALFPDEISGGMQKRLGIARALTLRPQVIFYDDPTAGLDPITSRKIVQLILDLKRQNQSTVVAVTNDMNRAEQLADRIAMVVDHELIVCGTPAETRSHRDPRVQQFIHGNLVGPLTVQA